MTDSERIRRAPPNHGSGPTRDASRQVAAWRSKFRSRRVLEALFVALLLIGGGAGARYPLLELITELLALCLIVRHWPAGRDLSENVTLRRVLILLGLAALLLAAQLVPLPPEIWRRLPGREIAVQIGDLIDLRREWRPYSLTPDLTVRALIFLTIPLAALLTAARLSTQRRVLFLRVLVSGAVVGGALGALQVACGPESAPLLYETPHRGFGVGFFVDRNHQAAFMLVLMLLAGGVPGLIASSLAGRWIRLGLIAFFALAVAATGSRTGLLMLPGAALVALALVFEFRWRTRAIGAAVALYVAAGLLLARTDLLERTFARFAMGSEEARYQYWANTLYLIRELFPFGTGAGSFDTAYQTIEPLAQVAPLYVNSAHNEYLELLLEGGLPAALLIATAFLFLGITAARLWRAQQARRDRSLIVASIAGLTLLLLFSTVEYPLRMSANAALFGALLGILASMDGQQPSRSRSSDTSRRWHVAQWFTALGLAGFATADGIANAALFRGLPGASVRLAPWSAQAWSALADQEFLAGRPSASRDAAHRALAIDPMAASTLRAHALADAALGRADRGSQTLQLGAALGWRDTLMQISLAQLAIQAGAADVAAERLDALMRRQQVMDLAMRQLRSVYQAPGGHGAIAARLGDRPGWRQGFLNAIAGDAARDPSGTIDFLQHLRAAGVPATSSETMLIRWRLADLGDFEAARQVWRASGGQALVAEGDFESVSPTLPSVSGPYSWSGPEVAGVRVSIVDEGYGEKGKAAIAVSDGLATGSPLAQMIVLAPGRYRLGAALKVSGALPASVTISCSAGPERREVARAAAPSTTQGTWRSVEVSFSVPAVCAAQVVALTIGQSEGEPGSVWIDNVHVDRYRGH